MENMRKSMEFQEREGYGRMKEAQISVSLVRIERAIPPASFSQSASHAGGSWFDPCVFSILL